VLAETVVERLGDIARCRGDEAGPVALADIAIEGELTDAEHLALAQRLVHAAVDILEDAQSTDLVGEAVGLRLGVLDGDAEQNQQPGTDTGDAFAVDLDRSLTYALDEGSQTAPASSSSTSEEAS
jgi:hypothetical protein